MSTFVVYSNLCITFSYNPCIPELADARLRARKWMFDYNSSPPIGDNFDEHIQACSAKLENIIGHVSDKESFIEAPFRVDYGSNIKLGKRFFANFNCVILDCALVTIGDRVMFGPNVTISTATHETSVASRRVNIEYAKPIVIGDDCWFGSGVQVLPGVTIGEGCTVAAGAVVTKDIPPWSVAMGIPARVVQKVEVLKPATDESIGSGMSSGTR